MEQLHFSETDINKSLIRPTWPASTFCEIPPVSSVPPIFGKLTQTVLVESIILNVRLQNWVCPKFEPNLWAHASQSVQLHVICMDRSKSSKMFTARNSLHSIKAGNLRHCAIPFILKMIQMLILVHLLSWPLHLWVAERLLLVKLMWLINLLCDWDLWKFVSLVITMALKCQLPNCAFYRWIHGAVLGLMSF